MEMGTEGWEFLGKTLTFSVRFSSRPNFPVFLERKDFTLGEKAGISFLLSLKGFFLFLFLKSNQCFQKEAGEKLRAGPTLKMEASTSWL